MSAWMGLAAGVQGLQQGVDFSQQALARQSALRDMRDERTRKDTVNELESQFAAPETTTVGAPQAASAAQPAPQPAPQGQEAAPATPTVGQPQAGEDLVGRALQGLRSLFTSRGATGAETSNPEAVRQVATGQGLPAGDIAVQGMRAVGGNPQGPLSQRDLNAYLNRAREMFAQRGIGHLYDEWQSRTMQSLQSSAYRSLVFASAAMDAGNPQVAAQWLKRAYGYIPDGADGNVQVAPDGSLVAQRHTADGQPIGQPVQLNAQRLREMAISMADPSSMETLLLRRDTLAEQKRHNTAQESLMAQRIAAMGARGKQPGETSLTVAERNKMYEDFFGLFNDQAYTSEAEARPGWFGATGPQRLSAGQARSIGLNLIENGTPPTEAARLATAIGLRKARPVQDEASGEIVGVNLDGATMMLPPSTRALLRHYNGAASSGASQTAPTHSGPRALRQPPPVQ